MMTARTWEANGCGYEADDGYQAVILPMAAHGKARPRVTVKGTYMPDDYQQARAILRSMFGSVTVRLPAALKVTVVRKIAASASRKRRAALMWRPCTVKPDNDNVEGWIMDALFGKDEAVVLTGAVKVWGPRDLLRIELREIDADAPLIDGEKIFAGFI